MPNEGYRKPDPLTQRVKVQFSKAQEDAIAQKADENGLTVAGYIRAVVLADMETSTTAGAAGPRQARKHATMLEVAELHALAMQVKKLGTNVNQLAKQANAGMVPISRNEVVYLLNQHQLLMSNAISTVEKLLA